MRSAPCALRHALCAMRSAPCAMPVRAGDRVPRCRTTGAGGPAMTNNPLLEIERRRGKIVVATSRPPRALPRTVHRSEKYHRSVLAGAAAFLYANQYEGYGPETGSIANDREAPIPGISISRESAAYLERLAERLGTVALRLETTDSSAPATSWNVTGELPGEGGSGEWVLLGCHYDGHDISQGAEDPASGAVAVLEAARVLAAHTTPA